MYVLGFVGSPRHGGNTDILVEEALRAASELGGTSKKIYLADLHIEPCKACDACRSDGVCATRDDMDAVRAEMEKADAYVIGTPVYFWGPSAQLKKFVDRWYAFQRKGRCFMNGKKAAVVCAFGDEDPATARNVVGMFEEAFKYLEVDFVDRLLVSAYEKGEVKNDQKALEAARALGRKVVTAISPGE